ncbi:class I SAM-dependent methyltransferase [Gemella cuniculi]|uniref:class I SAM-dependent methyltransferase n=1 Tax=Gemella cuniculi TaxID=150240 RepID=UPI0003FE4EB8|nr:class I SAM-dependent methyltransferase [Gemella cuniculi]
MKNIAITTSVKTNDYFIDYAQKVSKKLALPFIKREKKTIKEILKVYTGLLVIYKNKISYYEGDEELFFHPNTATLKIKNFDNEPLINIIEEKNQYILDATMGLAGDSTIMSYHGHNVIALEENKIIHLIVSNGLKSYVSENEKITQAMRNIKTICVNNLEYLKHCTENSFDIIYFDPMFSHNISESKNLSGLEKLATKSALTAELVKEAKRVAKKKIIIKAHYKDDIFEKFGFTRIIRKNTKFHYGYIKSNS